MFLCHVESRKTINVLSEGASQQAEGEHRMLNEKLIKLSKMKKTRYSKLALLWLLPKKSGQQINKYRNIYI